MRSAERLCETSDINNPRQFDTPTIREYLYSQKENLLWSAKTFRNERQYLKSFFDWLVREQVIRHNPVEKVEKPKLPKRLPRFVTKDEALSILANAQFMEWRYGFNKVRNVAIIAMFLMTGLRLSELINLRVQDVDFDSKEIFVKQGKGKKDRIVPLYPKLEGILISYLAERRKINSSSQWFFHSRNSEQKMRPKTIQTICKKISKAAGVKFTPHMLRHTMGRLSLSAGLGIFNLKEILGHADIASTMIYSSVSKEDLKRSFTSTQLF